jgi:uncharacterized membrane protein YeaQ/YmgE (transglycosylase-associated protein family)
MELIINLISGAVGGNVAGGLMKNLSLGTVWNSVVGILGGGLGGQILGMLGVAGSGDLSSMDLGSIVSSIGGSAVGGGVLLAVVGMIKKAFVK